jgi:Holliday junction resolvase RusA-like endonuclease
MRLITQFYIVGQKPVPWSVPKLGANRKAEANPKLIAWRDVVRQEAKKAMTGLPVETGPVRLETTFYTKTPPGKCLGALCVQQVEWDERRGKYTKRGWNQADLTNLKKGIEDVLQGVVYGDDVQVASATEEHRYGQEDGVWVKAFAMGKQSSRR